MVSLAVAAERLRRLLVQCPASEVSIPCSMSSTYDNKRGELALTLFDFMQNAADLWRRSNIAQKREILAAVSLNRLVSDVTLVLEKRKPFDISAEGPLFLSGRGDRI